MSWNAERPTLCIGVVGCGTMGRGIAQIAAQAGIRVRLFDQQPAAVAAARAAIGEVLQRLLDKGRITPDDVQAFTRGVMSGALQTTAYGGSEGAAVRR